MCVGWWGLGVAPFVGGVVVVGVVGGLFVFVEAEDVVAGVVALFPLLFFLLAHGDSVVCGADGWADPFVVDSGLEPLVECLLGVFVVGCGGGHFFVAPLCFV